MNARSRRSWNTSSIRSRGPAHSAVTLNPDGSFEYAPEPGFAGADTFTYMVSDGHGGETTATCTITVT